MLPGEQLDSAFDAVAGRRAGRRDKSDAITWTESARHESHRLAVCQGSAPRSRGYFDGMTVVLISGVQGTGKTTLARAVAHGSGACVVSRDPIMQSLLAHGIPLRGQPGISPVPMIGHALQTVILKQQLTLGASIVLECIMTEDIVATWRSLCLEHTAHLVTVECICSDRDLHRDRVENRYLAGESQITWEIAGRAPRDYRTIPDADYVADAVTSVDTHVSAILTLLNAHL